MQKKRGECEQMAYPRYQGYQYETSPRKLQPEYEPRKNPYEKKKSSTQKMKKESKKNKKKMRPKAKLVIYLAASFAILFAISYQNSLITESFNEKEELKKSLSAVEKENEQLKVNIETSLNLNKVEQSAKELLGMQKLDKSQKVYISLPKKDYIEAETEEVVIEENTSFWQKLIQNLSELIK